MLQQFIEKIPEGYVEGIYNRRKYGISKQSFNAGKSVKIYAEELGGKDFISLNVYQTNQDYILKPCEMPVEKVMHFLEYVELKN